MKRLRAGTVLIAAVFGSTALALSAGWKSEQATRCDGIKVETEKAVCADPALATLEERLAKTWKTYLTAFDDEKMNTAILKDQREWLAQRNECKADAACIKDAYAARRALLTGKRPRRRFAGFYSSPSGEVTVYPANGSYLVSIHTADPSEGAWNCDVYGMGIDFNKSMAIIVSSTTFAAEPAGEGALRVPASEGAKSIEQQFCGLNGSISFTYTNQPLP